MSEFSFSTISNFDNHISSSIRGYDLLDGIITNMASFFAKKGSRIVDLGCTSGRMISKMAEAFKECECIGYDVVSSNFIDSSATLLVQDLADASFEIPTCNIALSVFTLQFMDVDKRVDLVSRVYQSLNKNGAFIVCEKEICNSGAIQEVFTFSNYDFKTGQFTPDEILSKERDLRKIMNPLNDGENMQMLKSAGFKIVEPFFQSLNFKGWICIK